MKTEIDTATPSPSVETPGWAGQLKPCGSQAMLNRSSTPNRHRILIVDDNPAIHEDFRKVLGGEGRLHEPKLLEAEAALFGEEAPQPAVQHLFEID